MALSNYNPGQELASTNLASIIGGSLSAIVDAQAKAALSTVDFIKSVGFTKDVVDEDTGEVIEQGKLVYVNFQYPKMVKPYEPGVKGKIKSIAVKSGGKDYKVSDILIVDGIEVTVTEINASGSITKISFSKEGSGYENETNVGAAGGGGTGATFDIAVQDIDAIPAEFQKTYLSVPLIGLITTPHIRVEEGEVAFNVNISSVEHAEVGTNFNLRASFSRQNTNTNNNYALAGNSLNYNKNTSSVNFKSSIAYQRTSRQGHKIDKTYHMGVKIKVIQDEMPEGMGKLLDILEDAIISTPTENQY
ncbi:DUF2589 domain-containing protein [Flavilitoribacter nigricans]|uniref:DUF2589 domain-containing protein n=1 Tax=Flavilitoribacter nigricans (strain ATCC 23147 / DSM 23189 / NBRC 102662 / NCIMB 1420 / SS-2) TaxID=1122177 RepID=A0A2D0NHA4_FLAN2|nr:DUF2589 domain-containing protein [Flavilitoribacter nigricans]PHN07808.1 hypothetical protein CRP01_04615 [Flavilitoribacter nigricans DSM 23189 = NBRC 102662]